MRVAQILINLGRRGKCSEQAVERGAGRCVPQRFGQPQRDAAVLRRVGRPSAAIEALQQLRQQGDVAEANLPLSKFVYDSYAVIFATYLWFC